MTRLKQRLVRLGQQVAGQIHMLAMSVAAAQTDPGHCLYVP